MDEAKSVKSVHPHAASGHARRAPTRNCTTPIDGHFPRRRIACDPVALPPFGPQERKSRGESKVYYEYNVTPDTESLS